MNIYDITVKTREDKDFKLSTLKGKVLLIVNTATGCGFTPQYEALEKMYEEYKNLGFVILDFPCNQFANQAPGTDDEIQSFCTAKYNVSFPIFAKTEVNGENANPVFKYLKQELAFKGVKGHPFKSCLIRMIGKFSKNTKEKNDIKWNFTKFLVGKDGKPIERFEPTAPMKDLKKAIEQALKA